MRAKTVTRTAAAILVGVVIAPVAPAVGQDGGAATTDRAGSPAQGIDRDQVVLRHAGDRAVPFDPVLGAGEAPVLRRDGSTAEPFLAQVGPPAVLSDGDGFDWGDALIGAAGAYALILLASGAVLLIRRKALSSAPGPTPATSASSR